MMHKALPILVASILSIGTVVTHGQSREPSAGEMFKSLDRDGDAKISKSEATGDRMVSEHFPAIDKDGDGYATQGELSAHLKEMKSKGAEKEY